MLTKEAALALAFEKWSPELKTETVPTDAACDRVLAEDVYAQYALPVVRAAIMDSVALQSASFEKGLPDTTGWSCGVDWVRADMGDDFDDRFDCAIPVESVTFCDDGSIRIHEGTAVKKGVGIRESGSTVQKDALLLKKGTRLVAIDLAVLAIGGVTHVSVVKRPVVAIIPTGSELVALGVTPSRGQMIEANSVLLCTMLRSMGAAPLPYPILRDDVDVMSRMLEDTLQKADIIIINGGSSKGSEDFAPTLLGEQGELLFHGVLAAPGKPLGISMVRGKPVVNLPGPPPAAFAVANWCLSALVAKYLGVPVPTRHTVTAELTDTLETPQPMEFTARVAVRRAADGRFLADPIAMGRDTLVRTVGASGVFVSPIGQSRFEKGSTIQIELLREEEYIL